MTIIEQLTEYCDCVDVNEEHVYELVNLISSYTGWMQNLCETFLLSERREVIDLPDCACGIIEFEPYYRPFDYDSFRFYLVEQSGIFEELTELKECEVRYSTVDDNFKVMPPLPKCGCDPCGCGSRYKLLVTYTAGYELIPDCLLPLFCEGLKWIKDCCDECQECDTSYENNEISITTLEGRLQEYFLSILSKQYFKMLSLIALNRRARHLWGIVV